MIFKLPSIYKLPTILYKYTHYVTTTTHEYYMAIPRIVKSFSRSEIITKNPTDTNTIIIVPGYMEHNPKKNLRAFFLPFHIEYAKMLMFDNENIKNGYGIIPIFQEKIQTQMSNISPWIKKYIEYKEWIFLNIYYIWMWIYSFVYKVNPKYKSS